MVGEQEGGKTGRITSSLIVLLLVVCAFVAHAMYTGGAIIDDAYIAFRYSENLAAGAGLSFRAGDPPVEGYTCFTWVVLGAALARVGLTPAVGLPLLGIAIGAWTIVVVVGAARRLNLRRSDAPGVWGSVLPGVLLAASPGFAYYAGSGLETPLFLLLVALATAAALEGRPRSVAVASAFALLTRPEGAVVAFAALSVGAIRAPSDGRRPWRVAAGVVLGVALAYAAFKVAYFGALLPNTARAKPPDLRWGLVYTGWGLVDAGPLFALAAFLVFRERRAHADLAYSLGIAALLVGVAIAEGGDFMPAGRFLLPALTAGALAIGVVGRAFAAASGRARLAVGLATAAASAFFLCFSWVDTHTLHETVAGVAHYEPFRDDLVRRMREAGVRSVGTLDIGRISYVAPDLRILDLGGLVDREIASAPGDYVSKRIDPSLLERRAPDAFLFTARSPPKVAPGPAPIVDLRYPVEATIEQGPWFRTRYRLRASLPVRSDFYLLWYQRTPE